MRIRNLPIAFFQILTLNLTSSIQIRICLGQISSDYIWMFDLGRIQNFSVADPGLLSRNSDPNFFHPGSRVKKIPGSRIRIHIKELKYLTKKWSKIFIPVPDLDFLPIPDPRSQIHGSKRHLIQIRNTAKFFGLKRNWRPGIKSKKKIKNMHNTAIMVGI